MKKLMIAFLLPLTFLIACSDDIDKPEDQKSRLVDKTITLDWQTALGVGFEELIPNQGTFITKGKIDGADKVLVIDCINGEIEADFNAFRFREDRLFKSNKWLTSSNTNFEVYDLEKGESKIINPGYNANNASGVIDDYLYFAGRFGPSESTWDHNLVRYNLSTNESEYLHFACVDGINSFKPHFFIKDERYTPSAYFYYVYGKDPENPFSLTFAKFEIPSKSTKDLFQFDSKGNVTQYTIEQDNLVFLNYDRTQLTKVNMDNGERIATRTFDNRVNLVERTSYAQESDGGVITLYHNETGKKLWTRDYSSLRITSNIAVDENYAYATGYKTLYVLDKVDGEIIYSEELAVLGESTENGLDQTIYCYANGKLVVKNAKTAYGLSID